MSNAIPYGWDENKLEQITRVIDSAHQTPQFSNSGIPMVRVGDINGGKVSLDNTKFVTEEIYKIFAKNHEPAFNDILMTRVGSYGRSSIVKTDKKFCLGQNTVVINPKSVDSDFLFQFLQTENVAKQVEDTVGGSSQKSLSLAAIKSLNILTPPLSEQQKIAKILTSVDEVIEKTQTQIDKLKDLKSGLKQELLTNGIGHAEFKDSPVGKIPADWAVKKFGDITLEHKQGYYSKNKYTIDGTYIIRITDMQNPYISFDEMPKMQVSDKDKEAYEVLNGDFLFARSGAIGRYGIFDSNNEAVFASYLIRFRFDVQEALNEFVGFWYESDVCQKQLGTITQGSSNININAQNIKELKIPIPSICEQRKITEAILSVVKKITSTEQKLNALKNTKIALMQDLLTGKVRVKVDS